ncbi:hypothetical protein GGR77_003074 [Xanthomonas translucens]
MSAELLHGFRALRLPLRQEAEEPALALFENCLRSAGASVAEATAWVAREHGNLKEHGQPSPEFRSLVESILQSASVVEIDRLQLYLENIYRNYFSIYEKLQAEYAFTHEQAISALGFSLLIVDLSLNGRMSAAQISKSLKGVSGNIPFSRQSIGIITQALGCDVKFSLQQVIELLDSDFGYEPEVLADASFDQAAESVALMAARLGCREDLSVPLRVLMPRMLGAQVESGSTPYLQMLHFQCVICEFCDHAPTDIYEYSPRGERAEYVFGLYPVAIAAAGNPFLNNAKSVEVIEESWVRSKKSRDRPKARALYEILLSLESLGFSARRELALWLRLWISRIIRVAKDSPYVISRPLGVDSIGRLISSVSEKESGTFGIIEQRLVDLFALMLHPALPSRGVGDSVNATNLSSYKFGDCEFASIENLRIFAYEAHAGHLDAWYIDEHIRTLRRSVLARKEQITLLGGSEGWSLHLTFVSHTADPFLYPSMEIEGIRVEVAFKRFSEFFQGEVSVDSFDQYVTGRIWDARTPQAVRRRFLELSLRIEELVALDIENLHVRRIEEESAEYVLAYRAATGN